MRTPVPSRSGCPMRSGCPFEIRHKPNGSGELRLGYANLDQLDEIIRRLGKLKRFVS